MSLVKLRIEIEQELQGLMNDTGFVAGPLSIGAALVELTSSGRAPQNTPQFRAALRILNQAAHGIDVDTGAATEAADVAARFLADLRANRPGGSHTRRT